MRRREFWAEEQPDPDVPVEPPVQWSSVILEWGRAFGKTTVIMQGQARLFGNHVHAIMADETNKPEPKPESETPTRYMPKPHSMSLPSNRTFDRRGRKTR